MNSMSTKFTKSRIRPNQIHPQLRCDMAKWGDSHLMHLHCCHHYNNRQKTSVDIRQSFLISTSFPSSLDMSNKKIPFPKRRKRPGSSLLFYSNQYFIHKTVTKQCINLPFRRRHDLNAVKLTRIHSLPAFGVGGSFVFQLNIKGQ